MCGAYVSKLASKSEALTFHIVSKYTAEGSFIVTKYATDGERQISTVKITLP